MFPKNPMFDPYRKLSDHSDEGVAGPDVHRRALGRLRRLVGRLRGLTTNVNRTIFG
jgi:hypothetical protein